MAACNQFKIIIEIDKIAAAVTAEINLAAEVVSRLSSKYLLEINLPTDQIPSRNKFSSRYLVELNLAADNF